MSAISKPWNTNVTILDLDLKRILGNRLVYTAASVLVEWYVQKIDLTKSALCIYTYAYYAVL